MNYYVYILKSEVIDKFYIGSSQNPENRLIYHNSIEKGFTSRYRPWKLVYKKEFKEKSLALQFEKKIKSWKSSKMIIKLINDKV